MKKLKLNLQQLENAEILTRSQLKDVLGGSVSVTTAAPKCTGTCVTGENSSVNCGNNRVESCGCPSYSTSNNCKTS